MHTGLVGVAEFDEKLAGVEREEFGPARWTAPTNVLFTLVGKDSGAPAAHFSFWTPWRGGCAGAAAAGAGCAKRYPNPTELPPWPEPKTGRSAGLHTHAPSKLVSTAPRPGPFLYGCALRSSIRYGCSRRQPWRATVSRAQRPSCSSSSKRPCFHPWRWHPVGGLASTLARLPQRRQAAAVHAPRRFRTASPRSRSVWSAPACWRFRSSALLPETYGPTFASQKRHDFLRTRRHTRLEAPIPPRPGGGCTRTGGLGLKTARLRLQSSFPRSRRGGRWQVQNPNPPPSRQVLLKRGAVDLLNHPPHSRDLCR